MGAVLLIFGSPILAAWVAVQVAPDALRAYIAIAVYFMSTFLAIELEVERDCGSLNTFKDAVAASKFGLQAFAWWAGIMLSIIGIAWFSAIALH
jgi:hypothetical protein